MVLRNKADVSAGMRTQQRGVLACKHTVVTQTLTPPQYFFKHGDTLCSLCFARYGTQ